MEMKMAPAATVSVIVHAPLHLLHHLVHEVEDATAQKVTQAVEETMIPKWMMMTRNDQEGSKKQRKKRNISKNNMMRMI
jgi:hypothetical protein